MEAISAWMEKKNKIDELVTVRLINSRLVM